MSKSFWYLSCLLLFICLFSFPIFAEDDPNPDSPTPVLLGQSGSSQILAVDGVKWNGRIPRVSQTLFRPAQNITLFVTNLDLMDNEGANALRVYLYQKSGKIFELQTEDLTRVDKTVYALKVRIFDRDGYRGQPVADGESVIYLTWRGLVSNALKISLGTQGGEIKIPDFLKQDFSKAETSDANFSGYRWSGDRARFFEQATFGATTELDNRVRRIGLRTWLAEQFEAPYPTNPYPEIPLMPSTPPSNHFGFKSDLLSRAIYDAANSAMAFQRSVLRKLAPSSSHRLDFEPNFSNFRCFHSAIEPFDCLSQDFVEQRLRKLS